MTKAVSTAAIAFAVAAMMMGLVVVPPAIALAFWPSSVGLLVGFAVTFLGFWRLVVIALREMDRS
jgi:uncharacterized membrane protein